MRPPKPKPQPRWVCLRVVAHKEVLLKRNGQDIHGQVERELAKMGYKDIDVETT